MSDAETKVIVGKCVEYAERNGWSHFKIDTGSQYPTDLSTKLPDIIEAGKAVGSETATWTFKQSDGNPNPNKPGSFYQNRHLSKVEVGEHTPAATATGTAPQQTALPVETTSEPVDWDAKERRDYRSRAWAITVSAFTHTIQVDEDPAEVFKRLLPFKTRLYHDVVRKLGIPDDHDIPFE